MNAPPNAQTAAPEPAKRAAGQHHEPHQPASTTAAAAAPAAPTPWPLPPAMRPVVPPPASGPTPRAAVAAADAVAAATASTQPGGAAGAATQPRTLEANALSPIYDSDDLVGGPHASAADAAPIALLKHRGVAGVNLPAQRRELAAAAGAGAISTTPGASPLAAALGPAVIPPPPALPRSTAAKAEAAARAAIPADGLGAAAASATSAAAHGTTTTTTATHPASPHGSVATAAAAAAAAELDEAFLGLGVTDPALMNPIVDYSIGRKPPPNHFGDTADLTPPRTSPRDFVLQPTTTSTTTTNIATTTATTATATTATTTPAAPTANTTPAGATANTTISPAVTPAARRASAPDAGVTDPAGVSLSVTALEALRKFFAKLKASKVEGQKLSGPVADVAIPAPVPAIVPAPSPAPPEPTTCPVPATPPTSTATGPGATEPSAAAMTVAGTQSGTVRLRMDQVKQTIIGVGYSNAFYTNYWHTAHPYSDEIYDHILTELQPSMLRLRNNYGIDAADSMNIDVEFVDTAQKKLGYTPLVLMSSWSPPASLKASGQLNGSNIDPGTTDVLKKDANGNFVYEEFAKHWVDSLNSYASKGLHVDYYSPQNEPDYSSGGYPTCVFGALETRNVPGFYRATEFIFSAVQGSVRNPPAMVGPECTAIDKYIPEFPFGGGGRFAAVANHLYGSGTFGAAAFDPYSFSPAMVRAKDFALRKGIQNLWMTEFAKLSAFEYQDPLRLAIIMHNAFTLGDMSVYLHWDGAWGLPDSGPPTEGTLVLVDNPFKDRSQWKNPRGYQILHTFWWFKHFTRFVRPTYRRVQCDLAGLTNVLVSAWTGPNGEFSIIMINTGTVQTSVTLLSIPAWIPNQITDRYYSTLDVGFTYAGRFHGNRLSIPPLSITSLFSYHL